MAHVGMRTGPEPVSFTIQVSTKDAIKNIRGLQMLLMGVLMLLRRMGLPEPFDRAIVVMQRMIVAANALRMAIIALDVTTKTHPIGWAMAGVGAVVGILTVASTTEALMGY